MFLHVTDAKYLEDYKVEVFFDNGRKGVADLVNALEGPVFEALRNKTEFAALTVDDELQTIVWPNGVDLAPEYLFFQVFKDDPELQSQFKQWGYVS